jgi:hypothetical protein
MPIPRHWPIDSLATKHKTSSDAPENVLDKEQFYSKTDVSKNNCSSNIILRVQLK